MKLVWQIGWSERYVSGELPRSVARDTLYTSNRLLDSVAKLITIQLVLLGSIPAAVAADYLRLSARIGLPCLTQSTRRAGIPIHTIGPPDEAVSWYIMA